MLSTAILLPALLFAAATPAAAPAKPARLGLCAACHGESGIATAKGIPHLAGQDRDYLVAALGQYKRGERAAAAMRAAVGSLTEADIAALADWYSAQKAFPHPDPLPQAAEGKDEVTRGAAP